MESSIIGLRKILRMMQSVLLRPLPIARGVGTRFCDAGNRPIKNTFGLTFRCSFASNTDRSGLDRIISHWPPSKERSLFAYPKRSASP